MSHKFGQSPDSKWGIFTRSHRFTRKDKEEHRDGLARFADRCWYVRGPPARQAAGRDVCTKARGRPSAACERRGQRTGTARQGPAGRSKLLQFRELAQHRGPKPRPAPFDSATGHLSGISHVPRGSATLDSEGPTDFACHSSMPVIVTKWQVAAAQLEKSACSFKFARQRIGHLHLTGGRRGCDSDMLYYYGGLRRIHRQAESAAVHAASASDSDAVPKNLVPGPQSVLQDSRS